MAYAGALDGMEFASLGRAGTTGEETELKLCVYDLIGFVLMLQKVYNILSVFM